MNVLKGEPGSSGPASLCCSQGRRQPARQHTPPRGSRTPAPAWHGGALLSPPQALLILPGPLKPISPGASAVSSVQRPVSSLPPRPTPARPPRLMCSCVLTEQHHGATSGANQQASTVTVLMTPMATYP